MRRHGRMWLRRSWLAAIAVALLAAVPAPAVARAGGEVYAFGLNGFGELGSATNNRTNKPNPTPALVSLPGATGAIVQVAAGQYHSLAMTSTGQLYAFGDNEFGELGSARNNGTENPNPPALVSLPGATGPVVQIAAGSDFSLAVTSTGQLYGFGDNRYGQLGSFTNIDTGKPNPTPALVSLPEATGPVVQVAAGGRHSLAVTSTGQLYAFGDNVGGELGSAAGDSTDNPNPTPALVSLPGATGPVVYVAAGDQHSLAVTSTGQLYAFGSNQYGQLGSPANSGTVFANPTPALISLPGATGPVVRVAGGYFHSLAVTSTGQLYAFGYNGFGELGSATNNGTANPNATPALVRLPGGASVDTVAPGPEPFHALVVLAGLVVATGSLPGATVGQPYSAHLQASGGVAPDKWAVNGLPTGLSLDPVTGVISGTPIAAGSSDVTLTVADVNGIVASRTLTLSIAPTPASAPAPSNAPRLSALHISPRKRSLAGKVVRGRCQRLTRPDLHARRCRLPLNLRIRFTLSATGMVTVGFARVSVGRRVNHRCVFPERPNHKHPRCTRLIPLPRPIARTAGQGTNTVTITRTNLTPGTYQLTITPAGASKTGKPQQATITITS